MVQDREERLGVGEDGIERSVSISRGNLLTSRGTGSVSRRS